MPQSPTRHLSVRDKSGLVMWIRLVKCFGLAHRAARNCLKGQLTVPQFDVMVQLARNESGLNFSQLSDLLLVTPGNLTGIVERLVQQGLVTRQVNPQDRREVFLKLTTKGRELGDQLIPHYEREVLAMFAKVPEATIETLKRELGVLRDVLEADARKEGA